MIIMDVHRAHVWVAETLFQPPCFIAENDGVAVVVAPYFCITPLYVKNKTYCLFSGGVK